MPKIITKAEIITNQDLGPMVKQLVFHSPPIARQAMPGQFVQLKTADGYDPLLRRPFGIAAVDSAAETVSVIYRVVGRGTAALATLRAGELVDCLGPLGNGFVLQGKRPLLVGGGMGLAPLLFLAAALCPRPSTIVMGGRTEQELFWQELFRQSCDNIHVTTDDGSLGRRGVTVDVLPELLRAQPFDSIYACGPRVMMAAVARLAAEWHIDCQVSLEEHMACGLGACLSCTCATAGGGRKKVCSDGPVFWAQEVLW